MNCIKCGKQILDKDEFCENCRAPSSLDVAQRVEAGAPEALTGWRRAKYFLASFVLFGFCFASINDFNSGNGQGDVWSLVTATLFGLWGFMALARALNKTISEITKKLFHSRAVKTSGRILKRLIKLVFWLALACLPIWLIIAIGPLWIIAIILLLIFLIMAKV